MGLPNSGVPLSLDDIQDEFGGSNPIGMSEYFSAASGIPASGNAISVSDFYGAANAVSFTYEIIGGGGGGGYGLEDGYGSTARAGSGGNSSITASGLTTITSSGAQGGTHATVSWNTAVGREGDSSYYGAGPVGTPNGVAGASATASHYGAGGAGGGGDSPNKFDSSGGGGEGGDASSRQTGTATVVSGTTLTINIGSGGAGGTGGNHAGGNGAGGFVQIVVGSNVHPFTSNGTLTLTS
mgnify:FL=1|jgi:hypothetical protein